MYRPILKTTVTNRNIPRTVAKRLIVLLSPFLEAITDNPVDIKLTPIII